MSQVSVNDSFSTINASISNIYTNVAHNAGAESSHTSNIDQMQLINALRKEMRKKEQEFNKAAAVLK